MLKANEAETIESMGEALVPGARSRHRAFHRSADCGAAGEALLQARIMNVQPPFANFYRAAIKAIDGAATRPTAQVRHAVAERQARFINAMRQNKAAGWQGPPGPFVYAVLRSDAVDVVYDDGRLRGARRAVHGPHRAERRW